MEEFVWTYVLYTIVAVGLTAGLAATLFNNGKVFLAEVFPDNRSLAKAINNLLVTGFFMLNLGYAFLISRAEAAASQLEAIEQLVMRLGALLVSLGVIHFVNMAVFWKIRQSAITRNDVPATATAQVPPPPPPAAYPAPEPV